MQMQHMQMPMQQMQPMQPMQPVQQNECFFGAVKGRILRTAKC